jgi:hypothetical protein
LWLKPRRRACESNRCDLLTVLEPRDCGAELIAETVARIPEIKSEEVIEVSRQMQDLRGRAACTIRPVTPIDKTNAMLTSDIVETYVTSLRMGSSPGCGKVAKSSSGEDLRRALYTLPGPRGKAARALNRVCLLQGFPLGKPH